MSRMEQRKRFQLRSWRRIEMGHYGGITLEGKCEVFSYDVEREGIWTVDECTKQIEKIYVHSLC